jgi:hypothetical protein
MKTNFHKIVIPGFLILLLMGCNHPKQDVHEVLVQNHLENKIIPHKVDTKNAINMVIAAGFTGWELDILIETGDSTVFWVKHDEKDSADFTLKDS